MIEHLTRAAPGKMGIKNLTKFLIEKYPEVFDRGVKMDEYAHKTIAIDTAIFMCKFKATAPDAWLDAFVTLISWMSRSKVHPFFVLDDGFPDEKAQEKRKRAIARKKQEDRVSDLEKAVQEYNDKNGKLETISDAARTLLTDIWNKESKNSISSRRVSLLLDRAPVASFDIHVVKEKLARMKKHLFTITSKDYDTLKQLLDVLCVQWKMAPGEAEKECARMVKAKEAAAVLSEDSDCLAYHADTFLCKPDFYTKTMRRIKFQKMIDVLDMTPSQFTDFCIMCGTDYNPNMRGIGVCKSFDLIKKWKTINDLPEKLNTSVLNYKTGRALLTIEEQLPGSITEQPTRKKPVMEDVKRFFFKHNMRTPIENLGMV